MAVAEIEVDGDVEESSLLDSGHWDDEGVTEILWVSSAWRGEARDVGAMARRVRWFSEM
jgi:hypothetical protein